MKLLLLWFAYVFCLLHKKFQFILSPLPGMKPAQPLLLSVYFICRRLRPSKIRAIGESALTEMCTFGKAVLVIAWN